jgi:hypothetical protein
MNFLTLISLSSSILMLPPLGAGWPIQISQALSPDKRKAQSEVLNLFLPFANQQGQQMEAAS